MSFSLLIWPPLEIILFSCPLTPAQWLDIDLSLCVGAAKCLQHQCFFLILYVCSTVTMYFSRFANHVGDVVFYYHLCHTNNQQGVLLDYCAKCLQHHCFFKFFMFAARLQCTLADLPTMWEMSSFIIIYAIQTISKEFSLFTVQNVCSTIVFFYSLCLQHRYNVL